MIKQIALTLRTANESPTSMFWAYNLYAQLLRTLPQDFAEQLHQTGLKPINHALLVQRGSPVCTWRVNLLGQEACQWAEPVLLSTKSFQIEKQSLTLTVENAVVTHQTDETALMLRHFTNLPPPKSITLQALSPCAFKSGERYINIPTPELILKSAFQKYNAFATDTVLDDPAALQHLIDHVSIVRYRLQSYGYSVKGITIPSFTGSVTLSACGPEQLRRLFTLLMHTLPFTGLGIKCTLGMGAITAITAEKEQTS